MSHRDDLSADVAARIAELVETELRHQVAEARSRLDAEVDERLRRLREVTDTLLERATAVGAELDGLAAAMRRAATDTAAVADAPLTGADIAPAAGDDVPAPVEPEPPHSATSIDALEAQLGAPTLEAYQPTVVQPMPASAAVATAEPGEPPSDAARLVAVEMALAGSSREEVDRHLRSAFDVRDSADLLDDVFGR